MHKFKGLFFILLSTMLLNACVTNIKISAEDRQSLKTVGLDPDVKRPENLSVLVNGETLGLIGLALTYSDLEKLNNFDIKHNIDLKKLILTQWKTQLPQRNIHISANSNTILTTEVTQFQILPSVPLSTHYAIQLVMISRLTRNGVVIWQDAEHVIPMTEKDLPAFSLQEIYNNPKDFEIMLNAAAERTIRKLIANLYMQQ
jgi:hypothetical protein